MKKEKGKLVGNRGDKQGKQGQWSGRSAFLRGTRKANKDDWLKGKNIILYRKMQSAVAKCCSIQRFQSSCFKIKKLN